MWPFGKSNKSQVLEDKSTTAISSKKSYTSNPFISYVLYGEEKGRPILNARQAINTYIHVAPVSTCIDMIGDEAKSVEVILQQTSDGIEKEIEESPLLDLLSQPNADQIQQEFLEAIYKDYLITGEAYILATGDINKPPNEIIPISPAAIEEVKVGKDGFVRYYKMKVKDGGYIYFYRDDGVFRFYDKEKQYELWAIKGFSPVRNGRGLSPLNQVYDEIEQYSKSNAHNIAVLSNGMRPSATFTTDKDTILTDEQFTRLIEQIERMYSGSKNAGRPMLLEGLKVQELMLTNRDMDFDKLTEKTEKAIAKRYKIPLPLISSDTMTYSNFESAQLALYDKAILPLVKMMCLELTRFLGVRFKLNENEQLTYDESDITALQLRRFEELKTRKEIGVETPNEMRSELGREPLESGGDFLYLPATMTPVGTDAITADNVSDKTQSDEEGVSADIEDDTGATKSRSEFIKLMKAQVDITGKQIYTDELINKLADEEGL